MGHSMRISNHPRLMRKVQLWDLKNLGGRQIPDVYGFSGQIPGISKFRELGMG